MSFHLIQQDLIETRKRVSAMARETLTVQMVGNAIVKYGSRTPKGLWQKFLTCLGIQMSFDLAEFEKYLQAEEKIMQDAVIQAQAQQKVQVQPSNLILAK